MIKGGRRNSVLPALCSVVYAHHRFLLTPMWRSVACSLQCVVCSVQQQGNMQKCAAMCSKVQQCGAEAARPPRWSQLPSATHSYKFLPIPARPLIDPSRHSSPLFTVQHPNTTQGLLSLEPKLTGVRKIKVDQKANDRKVTLVWLFLV